MLKLKNTLRMKLRTVVIIALLSIPFFGKAQMEFGMRFGIANYLGDVASRPVPSESNLAGGLFLRANLTAQWKLRGELTMGRISGEDRSTLAEGFTNLNFSPVLPGLGSHSFHHIEISVFVSIPKGSKGGSIFKLFAVETDHIVPNSKQQLAIRM